MAEISLKTDVLAPLHVKTINYTGENPKAILGLIPSLLKEVMKLSSTSLFEDKIKWDTTNGSFYGQWRGKDAKDNNSKIWIKVVVQGKVDAKNKGELTIWITGELETDFKYRTELEKPLILLYKKFLYSKQIRRYTQDGKRHISRIEESIKSYFGIGG